MGQRLQIEWLETADQLKFFYKWEHNVHRKLRFLVLWHLRQGKLVQEVAHTVGVCQRTIQYWLTWYRDGGLVEVLRRIPGHGSRAQAKLEPIQQQALAAKGALGVFRTVWDAVEWVRDRWGILYTYNGLYACLKRLQAAPKVPRPQSINANPLQQREWKERGLRNALEELGIPPHHQVWFCREDHPKDTDRVCLAISGVGSRCGSLQVVLGM